MSRAARFTQADLARCIRAAHQCGASHVLILPDGTIEIRLQSSDSSGDSVPKSKPSHRFGKRLDGSFEKVRASKNSGADDPLACAFDQFMAGEITLDQLPPGRYPNGMRVYADGEWEAIVRSRPLGKREIVSLKAYFDADGASHFYSGGPETNERLEIRGLIEISEAPQEGRMPFYRITAAGRAESLRLHSDHTESA
jgi:hypothetical protein